MNESVSYVNFQFEVQFYNK